MENITFPYLYMTYLACLYLAGYIILTHLIYHTAPRYMIEGSICNYILTKLEKWSGCVKREKQAKDALLAMRAKQPSNNEEWAILLIPNPRFREAETPEEYPRSN